MNEQLLDYYSELLSKEDIMELFNSLENKYGSIEGACRVADISKNTVYDWRHTKHIKKDTKMKILKASFEEYPDDMLEFVLEKARKKVLELIEVILLTIYDMAKNKEIKTEKEKVLIEVSGLLAKLFSPLHIDN